MIVENDTVRATMACCLIDKKKICTTNQIPRWSIVVSDFFWVLPRNCAKIIDKWHNAYNDKKGEPKLLKNMWLVSENSQILRNRLRLCHEWVFWIFATKPIMWCIKWELLSFAWPYLYLSSFGQYRLQAFWGSFRSPCGIHYVTFEIPWNWELYFFNLT